MSRPSEDELIARLLAPHAGAAGLGLRDDAALLVPPPGRDLVVTVDGLVAGVHFFPDDPPASIARKALRVNLSDLAAKRATPLAFLLTLALPPTWTADWIERFAAGLGEDAALFGCPLVGGDTIATPGPLTLSITAIGAVEPGTMLPRTAARAGDRLYISGTMGDAALGLLLRLGEADGRPPGWATALGEAARWHLRDRYLHPQPRLALHAALAHARAGMDVSDGLVGDATKMLRVSGVSGRIELAGLPLSRAAAAVLEADPTAIEAIATGGDDYEILATVAPEQWSAFEVAAAAAGVPVTVIGDVLPGAGPPEVFDRTGRSIAFQRGSYRHA